MLSLVPLLLRLEAFYLRAACLRVVRTFLPVSQARRAALLRKLDIIPGHEQRQCVSCFLAWINEKNVTGMAAGDAWVTITVLLWLLLGDSEDVEGLVRVHDLRQF
jgi:hypothetical protein